LEAGYRPEDMVEDKPIEIDGWQPKNSSGKFAGEISLRTAFAYSKNTVAAQIGQDVGTGSIANMARRFGITTPVNTQPSMVLGTSDTRVIDMTQAFAAVAAGGRTVTPYGITKVTTIDGELLYAAKPSGSVQLVDDWVAGAMTDLLQSAVTTGTGRAANIGRPVAGKTGTTSSNKDGWFLGFSSGLTTGVWMGRDDARRIGGLEGGRAPAQAWAAYMRVAVTGRPVEKFATEVTFPEALEGEDALFGADEMLMFDENGLPIEGDPLVPDPNLGPAAEPGPEPLDDAFIERALNGRRD
jgi:penicillin-binding protein 1A